MAGSAYSGQYVYTTEKVKFHYLFFHYLFFICSFVLHLSKVFCRLVCILPINCPLIDISIWNYPWSMLITDSVYPSLAPNALLCIVMYSAQDALLAKVSIQEVGYTYKGQRIKDKYSYPCLSPNA